MAEYIEDGITYHAVDYLNKLGLSAHSLITPSGVNIRCRKNGEGAYHAKNFNTDSLGIEILVPGVHTYQTFIRKIQEPYCTQIQYDSTVSQVKDWIRIFGITEIKRHSDIDPTRKKDPGDGFPWTQFLEDVWN